MGTRVMPVAPPVGSASIAPFNPANEIPPQPSQKNQDVVVQADYTPNSVLQAVCDYICRTPNVSSKPITVQGLYVFGNYHTNTDFFDYLKEQFSQTRLEVVVPHELRYQINQNDLVVLHGVLKREIRKGSSSVNIQLLVDNIQKKLQEKVVSDDDLKRIEILQQKSNLGKKPVKTLLLERLLRNENPKVLNIIAKTSRTEQDFNDCSKAAPAQIDFIWSKEVAFSYAKGLCDILQQADRQGYDAICLVRGGGSGLEELDNINVLSTLMRMQTPIVAAVGHSFDHITIKDIADHAVATPSALGQFFNDLVEQAARERNQSTKMLEDEIKGRYVKTIADLNTDKNKLTTEKTQLQTKLENLTKEKGKVDVDYAKLKQQVENDKRQVELLIANKVNEAIQKNKQEVDKETEQKIKDARTAADLSHQLEIKRIEKQYEETISRFKTIAAVVGFVAAITSIVLIWQCLQ